MIKVSIITSMYNKSKSTIKTIDALFFNSIKNHGAKDRELIILDDCSPLEIETRDLFKKHEAELKSCFGKVIFKRNPKNYGFGKSFNGGIKIASGKILFIVNDDIYLPKDCVFRLINVLDESDGYGISSPITGEKNTWTIQYCKQSPKLTSYSDKEFEKIEKFSEYAYKRFKGKRIKTDFVAGFCFAVSADLIKKYGGFDESFKFGLWEDVDLSRRINKKFDLIVSPGIYIHHGGIKGMSTSMLQHPIKTAYFLISNALIYIRKWDDFLGTLFYALRGEYRAFTGRDTVSELFKKSF